MALSAVQQYESDLRVKTAILLLRHRELFDAGAQIVYNYNFFTEHPHLQKVMEVALFLDKEGLKPSWAALSAEFGALKDDISPTIYKNGMDVLMGAYKTDALEDKRDNVCLERNKYI